MSCGVEEMLIGSRTNFLQRRSLVRRLFHLLSPITPSKTVGCDESENLAHNMYSGYIHEQELYTIGRINRRTHGSLCQRYLSNIVNQFSLAPFRSNQKPSLVRSGSQPQHQFETEMTILVFSDHSGSARLLLRPPIDVDLQRWLESSNDWMSAEAGWVSLQWLEVNA